MMPSVAYQSLHFSPHHQLDHRPSFSAMDQSYDLTNVTLHAALHQPQQLTNSFQPSSRTRTQFPQPIQRVATQSTATADVEHALRRKTPSGTIAAGYDATPGGDRSIQPPATKHIIVSSLDNGQSLSSQPGLLPDLARYNPDPIVTPQYPSFASAFNSIGRPEFSNTFSQGVHGGGWIGSLHYPGSVNPALNQNTAQPLAQRYNWQNGPTTPTVIASSFQPGPGQASSTGFGHYGSYWPDGGYVPYYPAALRDSRYQSTPQIRPNGQEDPLATFQTPFNRQSLPCSDNLTPGFSWNPIPAQSGQHVPQVYNHGTSQKPFPIQHVPSQNGPDSLWGRREPSYQSTHHSQPNVESLLPQGSTTSSTGLPSSASDMFAHQPRNAEFKEKVLSWAHSIYVDLLASLHTARKRGLSQGGQESLLRNGPNPSIYPKPPRQPASDFSSQSNNPSHNAHPFNTHSRTQLRQPNHAPNFLDQRLRSSLHISPTHNSFLDNNLDTRGHFVSSFDRRPSSDHAFDGYRNLRRSSAGTASRLFNPSHHGMSVTENAAAALDILSSLCIESNWEWIDGMLVGGCLAYGLGDYNKAMRWYSRIIARDPG